MESGPSDRFYGIWFLCLALGVAQMFPWNAYLTASTYFASEFPNFPYSFAMPIAFNWCNLASLFLMTLYGNNFSVKLRLRVGFFVAFAMLLLVPGINMTSLDVKIRIWLCLAATFFSGFSTAVLIGTGFGALAVLPPQYTTALMAGQGLAGVIVGALGLVLQFLVFPESTPHQVWLSGIIFFATAAGLIVLCTILSEILLGSHFYRFYSNKAEQKETNIQDVSGEEAVALIPQGPVTKMGVFKKIWPDALSVLLVFWVTLMLFPGFTVTIPNYDPALGPKTLGPDSKLPTILIALFQVCDLIGRFLPQLFIIVPKRFLLAPVLIRFGFIPVWFLMVYSNYMQSNIYPYVLMIVMALTNGYLSTLGMMFGPSRVSAPEAPVAGTLMSFFLQFGVFSGVHTAMIILLIIAGPSAVIGG